jgi:diguanylate cyclase (GGDEF)-like protein/PAS domain S-box-containing protein
MLTKSVLRAALAESWDGVCVSESKGRDNPIVFVNTAFERMTGYTRAEIMGKDCRFLQNGDNNHPALDTVRAAVINGTSVTATLRNYKKDGSVFWNEISLSPLRNEAGHITNYIAISRDVTDREMLTLKVQEQIGLLATANEELRALCMLDPLTEIYNRRFFDTQYNIHWAVAQRQNELLSVFMIDIDHFKSYNDTHGHIAGDAILRKVAKALHSSFRRGTDFISRYGGEEFVVVATGLHPADIESYALQLRDGVRALAIPHTGSPLSKITVSVGYAAVIPGDEYTCAEVLQRADAAMYKAKITSRDCVVGELIKKDHC